MKIEKVICDACGQEMMKIEKVICDACGQETTTVWYRLVPRINNAMLIASDLNAYDLNIYDICSECMSKVITKEMRSNNAASIIEKNER